MIEYRYPWKIKEFKSIFWKMATLKVTSVALFPLLFAPVFFGGSHRILLWPAEQQNSSTVMELTTLRLF